ncbi:MAG: hypothetical protein QOE92_36 [Chloroflexota bacterium]|jgi:hypothetical protein|nr:hypothetical protein [Chloroflexota bacterium]
MVASEFDRTLGSAVHRALLRWQRAVDGGAAARLDSLLARVREEAAGRGLEAERVAHALELMHGGLAWYVAGPWPRRATLFLEQAVRHRLAAADGFTLDLALRVDRVARLNRGVAIVDFKTVPPHRRELRADTWQLQTYALAAPELLGVEATSVRLFLLDLRGGVELEVDAGAAALAAATDALLRCGRGIAAGDHGVDGHPDRPCWSCGFRLTCPASLTPDPPRQ